MRFDTKEMTIMTENVQADANNEMTVDKNRDGQRIVIYLLMVFILTYIYEYFFVVRPIMSDTGNNIANMSLWVAIAMFFPALCVVITRLVTGEGFGNSKISFNLKNGRYRYYLLAWFLPGILTVIGILIYFAVFRDDYSSDMKFMIDTYAGQGISGITPEAARMSAISQAFTAFLIGPILNCLTCFGEEWGWRGYLLHKLKGKLRPLPLMVLTGVIWGLWHLPLTIMGHNYGRDYSGYPYLGIFAMIVFCFSIGTFFSYVTLKTDSCIPAVIGHGAVNSIGALGILFTKDGGRMLFGPSPSGLVSGIPILIVAIILIWFMYNNGEKEKK